MLLTDGERRETWSRFMSDVSGRNEAFGSLSKHDIRAAVDAIDQWTEDNAASFNAAIPQPARAELTTKQKVEIFFAIIKRRWEVG